MPLPGILFTSAPLVRTTVVSSASLSENKRGLSHCGDVEATINQDQRTENIIKKATTSSAKHRLWHRTKTNAHKRQTETKETKLQRINADPPMSAITVETFMEN